MTALHLDQMTWPEIDEEIRKGRDMVVVPFGSTEQHGRHLPLGTDAVLGDEIGWGLADRLDAFLAPTVRFGCSAHHLAFPGTISLKSETFKHIVRDVVGSLSRHGFRYIVLLPTHGGNFKPLAEVVSQINPFESTHVFAFTDLQALAERAFESSNAFGVNAAESGTHSGEWETSLMLFLRPKEVKMDCAAAGFLGELSEVMSEVFDGIEVLDENGVLGDPRPAASESGKRYLEELLDLLNLWVRDQIQQAEKASELNHQDGLPTVLLEKHN